jgi:hypothetical protein
MRDWSGIIDSNEDMTSHLKLTLSLDFILRYPLSLRFLSVISLTVFAVLDLR